MLAPPPEDGRTRDLGALDGEKKEKYIKSLENRLERLEGRNKRKLTSKDILRSLSESKDDHLRQLGTSEVPDSSLDSRRETSTSSGTQAGRGDPWSVAAPLSPVSMSSVDDRHSDLEYSLDFDDSLEVEDSSSCCSKLARVFPCCHRRRSQQRGLQSVGSNLTAEEEGEFLMECDELGITWDNAG